MPRPSWAGQRHIILTPTAMENVDADVWVDGKKQLKIDLDDPKRQLFKYVTTADFNGNVHVKIEVNSGSVVIGPKDAAGVYPVVYDNVVNGLQVQGTMPFKQFNHVMWLQNPSKRKEDDRDFIIEAGETFEYDHLIPNGPEWLEVYFHREQDRVKFLEEKKLTDKMIDYALFQFQAEYFVKDQNVSIEERTMNLVRQIGAW